LPAICAWDVLLIVLTQIGRSATAAFDGLERWLV
jgi:hypothetical protein